MIQQSCFNGCYGLKTVEIPDGVVGIQVGAFDWITLKKLILPDTIENIGYQSWRKLPEIECNKTLEWESRVNNQGTEDEYYDYWIGNPLYRGEANESSE